MAVLANTDQSEVSAQLEKIVVIVAITLSQQVSDMQMLGEVVAEQAGPGVAPIHVKLQTQGAADLRRLAQLQVSAEIAVPNATDVVGKAKQIQTRMQDSRSLADALARRGITASVDTIVEHRVSIKAAITTTHATLSAADVDSHLSQSLGWSSTTTSIEADTGASLTTRSESNFTSITSVTTSILQADAAAGGAEDSRYISIALVCVIFAVSKNVRSSQADN